MVLLVPLSVVLVRVAVMVETVPVEVEVLVTGPREAHGGEKKLKELKQKTWAEYG